jgi:hypothetical protein
LELEGVDVERCVTNDSRIAIRDRSSTEGHWMTYVPG